MCTRVRGAPTRAPGACAFEELLDDCEAAGLHPSADHELPGRLSSLHLPIHVFPEADGDGPDPVPCEPLLKPNRQRG